MCGHCGVYSLNSGDERLIDYCVSYKTQETSSSTCSFVVLRYRQYLIQAQQSRDSQLKYTFVALALKQVGPTGHEKDGGHVNTVVVVFALNNKLTHN